MRFILLFNSYKVSNNILIKYMIHSFCDFFGKKLILSRLPVFVKEAFKWPCNRSEEQ